jgi:hypothetical protein
VIPPETINRATEASGALSRKLEGSLRLVAGWTREQELGVFPNLLALVPEEEREKSHPRSARLSQACTSRAHSPAPPVYVASEDRLTDLGVLGPAWLHLPSEGQRLSLVQLPAQARGSTSPPVASARYFTGHRRRISLVGVLGVNVIRRYEGTDTIATVGPRGACRGGGAWNRGVAETFIHLLQSAPQLLPVGARHGSESFRAFVEVEMVASGTCLTGGTSDCNRGGGAISHLHGSALRRAPRSARTTLTGITQAPNRGTSPKLRPERPKAGARCHLEAQPPAESVARPMAASSSGRSSPVVLPTQAVRGVAG